MSQRGNHGRNWKINRTERDENTVYQNLYSCSKSGMNQKLVWLKMRRKKNKKQNPEDC